MLIVSHLLVNVIKYLCIHTFDYCYITVNVPIIKHLNVVNSFASGGSLCGGGAEVR